MANNISRSSSEWNSRSSIPLRHHCRVAPLFRFLKTPVLSGNVTWTPQEAAGFNLDVSEKLVTS